MPSTRRNTDSKQTAKDEAAGSSQQVTVAVRATRRSQFNTLDTSSSIKKKVEHKTEKGPKQVANPKILINPQEPSASNSGTECVADNEGKKRPVGAEEAPRKRRKTSAEVGAGGDKEDNAQEELLSPRRSSRAVVPNSRYKDMLDPRKKLTTVLKSTDYVMPKIKQAKKAVTKTPPVKRQEDVSVISLTEQLGESEVTEEIVTDETQIDTQAQMNLIEMDNILVLPPSTAHAVENQSIVLTAAPSIENQSIVLTAAPSVVGQASSSERWANLHSIDTLPGNNSDVHQSVTMTINSQVEIENENSVMQVSDDEMQISHTKPTSTFATKNTSVSRKSVSPVKPKPGPARFISRSANQIASDSSVAGAEASLIVIPPAQGSHVLQSAREKPKKSLNISKLSGNEMLYQQFSDKGKTVITLPGQGQLRKATSKDLNVVMNKDKAAGVVRRVIMSSANDATKQIKTGEIVHAPERKIIGPSKSPAKVITIQSKEVFISSNTDVSTEQNAAKGENITNENSTKNLVKKPHVKVIYMKPQSKGAVTSTGSTEQTERKTLIYQSMATKIVPHSGSNESGTGDEITITAQSRNENNTESSHTMVTDEADIQIDESNEAIPVTFDSNISEGMQENHKPSNENEGDTALVNSLCQVIEFKGNPKKKEVANSLVEYVMLNDKIVNVGSLQTKYGRVESSSESRSQGKSHVQHGRVYTVESGNTSSLKISSTVAQSAINSVIAQIEESHPTSINISDLSQVNKSADKRVVHGYIEHTRRDGLPTEIVEISPDLFTKEVYGENSTVDASTGAILENPVVCVVNPDTNSDQLNSVHTTNTDAAGSGETQIEVISTYNDDMTEVTGTPITTIANIEGLEGTTAIEGSDGIIRIEGLDISKLSKDTVITLEKMESGEEAVILHAGEEAVILHTNESEHEDQEAENNEDSVIATEVKAKQQSHTGIKVTRFTAVGEGKPSQPSHPPVRAMSDVRITPVQAYVANEGKGGGKQGSRGGVSTSTTTQTEDSDSDEYEEDPIELDQMEGGELMVTSPPVNPTIRRGRRLEVSSPYQEYVIVQLPEGSDIKQLRARPSIKKSFIEEPAAMDADGMYLCADCDHRTDKKSNWYKHRRKHLGIKPHGCTKCSYKAATSSNLKRHMQIHDDVRAFHCEICGLNFRQKIHMLRHYKYKHQEKKIQCPLCDFTCSNENPDLKVHIRRRHMPIEGNMEAFTCRTCGLMTVSKKDLKQHQKFHKKGPELKLFCEYCSFVTDCMSRLQRHLCVHTKERPFQCGLCPYRASQKQHVLRHMRSQHNVEVETRQKRSLLDIRTIVRDDNVIIPKDSATNVPVSSKYRQSESSSDSDLFGPFEKSDFSNQDKIFACNYCSMKFARLINLYKHLYAQHALVMPTPDGPDHQCVVCDFRTNSKKNLLVHMRKHNLHDHSPPTHVYSCVLCRYINPRRRNLFQHMKKKHGIEIVMKEDGLNCFVTLDSEIGKGDGQTTVANEIALSDIVKTETVDGDTPLQIMVAEDGSTFSGEKINIDNIIPIEDMSGYESAGQSDQQGLVSPQVPVIHASLQEHEAAEAIEGLQALAEQAGILETQNIDNDMTTEIVASEIMNDGEITITSDASGETIIHHHPVMEVEGEEQGYEVIGGLDGAVVAGEVQGMGGNGEGEDGIQLSTEQLNELSTGDYVEINGEVYKVEIAPDAETAPVQTV